LISREIWQKFNQWMTKVFHCTRTFNTTRPDEVEPPEGNDLSMPASFIIPATIEEIVQRYDGTDEPFDLHQIERELVQARQALVDPSGPENEGAWQRF